MPVNSSGPRLTLTLDGGLEGPPRPVMAPKAYLPYLLTDQVIREDPAVRSSYVRGRGTETSAEVLVGPPWRMESNAGQQQLLTDQVIRENPASRVTETSAEVLVGPPWRMESNAGQQQWY